MLVHESQQIFAFLELLRRHVLGKTEIAHGEIILCGIAAQAERTKRGAEIPGARIGVGLLGYADVRGKIIPRSELVRHHAAQAGILNCRAGPVTGMQVLIKLTAPISTDI